MIDGSQLYIPRLQAAKLRTTLATMRVVVLTGARQTGKTTLAQELGREEERTFISLDRPQTLELADRDPERPLCAIEMRLGLPGFSPRRRWRK